MTDTCVCCGAPVPEGRMVCWQCERREAGYGQKGIEEGRKVWTGTDWAMPSWDDERFVEF